MRPNTILLALLGTAGFAVIQPFAVIQQSAAQEQPAGPTTPPPVDQPATVVPPPAPTSPATQTMAPSTSPSERPSRGATMDSVKAKFGAPSQEAQAVGTPPITRWEYPGYVVYFENDRVLHTVVVR